MSTEETLEECADCGVRLAPVDVTPHVYLGGSPSCWAAFNEVLAREFQDARYFSVHRYTVDAYTAQHPGDQTDRRAAQSVNIHLAALCAVIDLKRPISTIPFLLGTLAKDKKGTFTPLTPPAPSDYEMTVADVLRAQSAEEHCELSKAWAEAVWRAWSDHHDDARALVDYIDNRVSA